MPLLPSIVEALVFSSPEGINAGEMARVIREAAVMQIEEEAANLPEPAEPSSKKARKKPAPSVTDAAPQKEEQDPDITQDLSLDTLSRIEEKQVQAALEYLIADYDRQGRAFSLAQRSSGWRVFAKGSYAHWARPLFPQKKSTRLSAPALETLAIIAYRQPLTKADIEAIRGVSVDGVMQNLLDRQLVRIEGRSDLPGRPLLYETTELFLDHFGIRHVEELPNSQELRRRPLPSAESTSAESTSAEPPSLVTETPAPEPSPPTP
jgi:segregation and condensation protein B